jgi:hypothetical protein
VVWNRSVTHCWRWRHNDDKETTDGQIGRDKGRKCELYMRLVMYIVLVLPKDELFLRDLLPLHWMMKSRVDSTAELPQQWND